MLSTTPSGRACCTICCTICSQSRCSGRPEGGLDQIRGAFSLRGVGHIERDKAGAPHPPAPSPSRGEGEKWSTAAPSFSRPGRPGTPAPRPGRTGGRRRGGGQWRRAQAGDGRPWPWRRGSWGRSCWCFRCCSPWLVPLAGWMDRGAWRPRAAERALHHREYARREAIFNGGGASKEDARRETKGKGVRADSRMFAGHPRCALRPSPPPAGSAPAPPALPGGEGSRWPKRPGELRVANLTQGGASSAGAIGAADLTPFGRPPSAGSGQALRLWPSTGSGGLREGRAGSSAVPFDRLPSPALRAPAALRAGRRASGQEGQALAPAGR